MTKVSTLEAARAQLLALRGRTHRLHSAAVVVEGGAVVWHGVGRAELRMRAFSESFLDWYMARAGSAVLESVGYYQVEALGVQLFERIEGDWFSILGLPLLPLLAFLRGRAVIEA